MVTKEMMSIDERFKYLRMMKERYRLADRQTKSRLLDEMEAMTGLHRKYLVARMKGHGPYGKERQREPVSPSPSSWVECGA